MLSAITLYIRAVSFQAGGGGRVVRWSWVNFQCPTIWMIVGQGPIALAIGAVGGCFDILTLLYPFLLFLPLPERRPDMD